ncbi:helix-turn-helix domain-containing protein [Pendulispora albinea]|uniref:Helix-turn-helix domain-containing protein n=1 Tax=Pendulispora albinea TaxID=2741071 RepID=A0ABZ2LWT0_9BACT
MSIGGRVKEALERAGIGYNQLDRAIGQSSGYTTRLVSGEKKRPDPTILARIANELGVSITWLIDGSGSPDSAQDAIPVRHYPNLEKLLVERPSFYTKAAIAFARSLPFHIEEDPLPEVWHEILLGAMLEERNAMRSYGQRTRGGVEVHGAITDLPDAVAVKKPKRASR